MRSASKGIPVLGFASLLARHGLARLPPDHYWPHFGRSTIKPGPPSLAPPSPSPMCKRATGEPSETDESGAYAIPSLIPSIVYRTRAEAGGFKAVERPNVQVEVATDVNVDMTLSPGSVKETVVVSDEVPLVNSTSSTLGGTLSNKEINDLPPERSQLRKSSAIAPRSRSLPRRRILHYQRERPAR